MRADGQEEFCFVDAHVHFYDMGHPELFYADWQPDTDDPVLGTQVRKLGERNYLAEDFIRESSPHGMKKAVHVQAAIGSKDVTKCSSADLPVCRFRFPRLLLGV